MTGKEQALKQVSVWRSPDNDWIMTQEYIESQRTQKPLSRAAPYILIFRMPDAIKAKPGHAPRDPATARQAQLELRVDVGGTARKAANAAPRRRL